MFDVYAGPVELTTFSLLFCLLAAFGLQLLLCFRVKALWLRLSLTLVVLGAFAAFVILGLTHSDFETLAYFILALLTLPPLAGCGAAWGLWAILRKSQNL